MKMTQLQFIYFFLGLSLVAARAFGQDEMSLDSHVKKLIQLRSEVEAKASQFDSSQKSRMREIEQLEQRRMELEQALSKERLRAEIADAKKIGLKDWLKFDQKTPQAQDSAVVETWVSQLEAWIQNGLPYKKTDRLREIEKIREKMKEGEAPEVLVQDLWLVTEKEIKLTQTNRFEVTTVQLEQEASAQVARIGLMQLYFKTSQGQVGLAEKLDQKWILALKTEESEVKAIEKVIAKLKAEKGSTYLELPGLHQEVQK